MKRGESETRDDEHMSVAEQSQCQHTQQEYVTTPVAAPVASAPVLRGSHMISRNDDKVTPTKCNETMRRTARCLDSLGLLVILLIVLTLMDLVRLQLIFKHHLELQPGLLPPIDRSWALQHPTLAPAPAPAAAPELRRTDPTDSSPTTHCVTTAELSDEAGKRWAVTEPAGTWVILNGHALRCMEVAMVPGGCLQLAELGSALACCISDC